MIDSTKTVTEWVRDYNKKLLINPDFTNWEAPPTLRYPLTVVLTNVTLLGALSPAVWSRARGG